MYRVEITNSQSFVGLDDAFLREVVTRTFTDEQVSSASIGLLVVDNATIRDLNCRHLGHDYDTDVLTFPLAFGKHIEGEIVVSAEMASDRAAEFGWRPEDELTLYVVHGLLHLAGYDDGDEPQSRLMRKREREILAHWNLSPANMDA
jgi:probable rRNA maturation factor